MKDRKQHIVFCSSSFYEYDRRIQRIINSLSADYQISWLARSKNNFEDNPTFKYIKLKHLFKKGALFYIELNIRIFIILMFKTKYSIISSVDLDTLPACWLVSILRAKKLVFDAHEIFHEVPELKDKKIKKNIWKLLSAFLFPKIKYKYTVNHSLAERFSDEFESNFDIIRNIAPSSTALELPRQQNKTLCYLGVVNIGRGIEIAIDALTHLDDYRLLIIGDGDIMQDIKSLSIQNNTNGRVTYTGYVLPEQIPEYLSKCSIALNMLDPSSDNYKYSLANKFFDYINSGLPAINMNFPEYAHINKQWEVSVLVDNYGVQDLVNAVRQLEDIKLYSHLQSQCMTAKQHLNWESESKKLLDIYKQL